MEKPFEVTRKDPETGAQEGEARRREAHGPPQGQEGLPLRGEVEGQVDGLRPKWYPREDLAKRGFIKWIKAPDRAWPRHSSRAATDFSQCRYLGNAVFSRRRRPTRASRIFREARRSRLCWLPARGAARTSSSLMSPRTTSTATRWVLAKAIDEFEGGVVLITHNKEFADATTKVTWVVANNRCDVKGDPEWEKYAAEQEILQEDPMAKEYFDAWQQD